MSILLSIKVSTLERDELKCRKSLFLNSCVVLYLTSQKIPAACLFIFGNINQLSLLAYLVGCTGYGNINTLQSFSNLEECQLTITATAIVISAIFTLPLETTSICSSTKSTCLLLRMTLTLVALPNATYIF